VSGEREMWGILVGGITLVCLASWALRRFRSTRAISDSAPLESATSPASAASMNVHEDALYRANASASERLWKVAFAAAAQPGATNPAATLAQQRVRANVMAILSVDTVQPEYFPRRPALLAQLLQAVDDPRAESEKLSRIVAHDPVLTAEIVRLANSSLCRTSAVPVETVQRAIVVCGVEALRGMAAAAMLRPVFRATRKNFPRLPRMLWERTERATRAAELYCMELYPEDRFEAQLAVLLGALGPLVVYGATLDVYSRNPHFRPDGDLCVELVCALATQMSVRVARDWEASPRLIAALGNAGAEALTVARNAGELVGTLSLLESQSVISRDQRSAYISDAGIPTAMADAVWSRLGHA
jgi:HD-like signal output (HDOD) protein